MIRVYVPTTLAGLAELASSGQLPAPFTAHAVTDAVRAEWSDAGEEEWEYEALCLAADDCAELWGPSEVRRRVVLAVDVSDATPIDAEDPTLVRVEHPAPLRRVAAVHADQTEADAEADDDLAWFGTQEIEQLLSSSDS